MPDTPIAQRILMFEDWQRLPNVDDPLHHDISAIAIAGETAFVACDETASVESLQRLDDGRYSNHRHFALGDIFDLPDGPGGEMDIEGLDVADGFLWVTGSHALKRDRPKRRRNGAVASLQRMMEIDRDPNRYFIGCVPLRETGPGRYELTRRDGERQAAAVKLKKNNSALLGWLGGDPHLGRFLDIPSKENGFDIEGIAAKGSRAWLGLRGPVLRGHGVVVELDFKRPRPGRLKSRRIDAGRRYRKHVIDTAGLGVRDMCVDGNDLLILTGTPLASDGPSWVLRWRDAIFDTTSGVVESDRIEPVLELPYRGRLDHPEGIAIAPGTGRKRRALIVVYDSPAPERIGSDPARLTADVFALAARRRN